MDNNSLDIDIKMKVEQMKKEISDATIGLKKIHRGKQLFFPCLCNQGPFSVKTRVSGT